MSKIEHDSVNNILKIIPDEKLGEGKSAPNFNFSTTPAQSQQSDNNVKEKKKLRGFILTYVETQEALDNYQKTGQEEQHRLMPVLSENEQSAVAFVRSKGLFPIRIYTYEYIMLQKRLIEQISTDNDIEIVVADVFDNLQATKQD